MNVIYLLRLKRNNYKFKIIADITNKLKRQDRKNFLRELINEVIPPKLMTIEIFEFALMYNYNINDSTPKYIKCNPIFISKAIRTYSNLECINYIDEKYITDEDIEYIVSHGYVINDKTPSKILNNKKYKSTSKPNTIL